MRLSTELNFCDQHRVFHCHLLVSCQKFNLSWEQM